LKTIPHHRCRVSYSSGQEVAFSLAPRILPTWPYRPPSANDVGASRLRLSPCPSYRAALPPPAVLLRGRIHLPGITDPVTPTAPACGQGCTTGENKLFSSGQRIASDMTVSQYEKHIRCSGFPARPREVWRPVRTLQENLVGKREKSPPIEVNPGKRVRQEGSISYLSEWFNGRHRLAGAGSNPPPQQLEVGNWDLRVTLGA